MQALRQFSSKTPSVNEAVAWKSLQHLVERFQLSEAEATCLMGDIPRSTYHKGISLHQGRLTRDQLERISYLLGIYKALRILFTDSAQALSWIDRENSLPPFHGMTPKTYLLEGSIVRLAEVRRFLDFWRGY